MVYGLVSLVARTCCIFYYLKSVEISLGFSVSCYHSREIQVYVYIQFNPVLHFWEELFCYGCLRTIFPFFLPFCVASSSISLYNVLFGVLLKETVVSLLQAAVFAMVNLESLCQFADYAA